MFLEGETEQLLTACGTHLTDLGIDPEEIRRQLQTPLQLRITNDTPAPAIKDENKSARKDDEKKPARNPQEEKLYYDGRNWVMIPMMEETGKN